MGLFGVRRDRLRGHSTRLALAVALGLLGPLRSFAQEAGATETENDGAAVQAAPEQDPQRAVTLLRLRLPLTGSDDQLYQGRLQRAVDALTAQRGGGGDKRPLLVLEFFPDESGGATEFERALKLARFLVSDDLAKVKTIAYLPRSIEGHAVLVALACEEIAMAPEAQIGQAGADEDDSRPLEPSIRAAYQQIAETRRTAPPAVVVAMVDPAAELVRVETERGVEYALRDAVADLGAEQTIVAEEVLSPTGSLGVFTGREGREQGFVKYLASDAGALARALSVAKDDLLEDQSVVADWRPVMIDVEGPLTPRVARRIETLIGDELERNNVNWIGLRIDSRSGDWPGALRLARTVAELGDAEVRSVAYVPQIAEGPAALVALACDQLVMQEGATLAGATTVAPAPGVELIDNGDEPEDEELEDDGPQEDEPLEDEGAAAEAGEPDEEEQPDDEEDAAGGGPFGRRLGGGNRDGQPDDAQRDWAEVDSVVTTIRESLAPEAGRGWSLLAAVVDERIELARYANRQTGERRLLGAVELESLDDRADWRRGERLKPAGQPLRFDSQQAADAGVAWQVVEQFDDLRALYGFNEPPRTAEPNWALELVEALASPGFAAMLLVIGVIGVYIELSTPGLGVGGFISAVAFMLFFWSKFLDGTADWLEVLLFVSGVVFVLIELVVLPGIGIFGLGGGMLMVGALVLASQTFILPKTESQLVELRNSLGVVAGAGVLCLGAAMALRQYLPHSPLFRRAMLMPPDEADRIEQDRREQLADYAHLVGRAGTATTDLLPAGRAEIDGELVDVITDGDVVDRGAAVEVVAAHANRVVVRAVRG